MTTEASWLWWHARAQADIKAGRWPEPQYQFRAVLARQEQQMEFVSYDTETTGLGSGARVVEIAAVKWRGGVEVARFASLVNPGCPIPAEATAIHGITDAMVADAPSASVVLAEFVEFVGDALLVGHNEQFDARLVAMELGIARLPQLGNPRACTLRIAKDRAKESGRPAPDNKLATLVRHFELPQDGAAHRALADALSAGRLFWRLRVAA